jgi:hypothetical protein
MLIGSQIAERHVLLRLAESDRGTGIRTNQGMRDFPDSVYGEKAKCERNGS